MKISAVIITFNEEDRLPDALESVREVVDEIVVVDSYSTDRTLEIARKGMAKVFQNSFQNFGAQKNFAMSKASHEWVLNLDADERLSSELATEIKAIKTSDWPATTAGFAIKRKTYYLGRWISHSGWYPDKKIRLFKKTTAKWQGRVHEKLEVKGEIAPLQGSIIHYTYRHIHDHINRLNRYSSIQAEDLAKKYKHTLPLRLLILPMATFLRHYILKRGFLDGFPGLIIALISSWGTALKYLKAIEIVRQEQVRHPHQTKT
jgi:glycosyltransferase involved in cell wall biosynthesis